MKGIENIFSQLSTGTLYTYALMIWAIVWSIPIGLIHIIAILLWELPYIFSGISSDTFFHISLVIKILILAYPISTLSPWNMLKTTFGGLLLFVITILSLSFLPPDLTLKNIFIDVGFSSKAYTVLLYLLYSNLLIPFLARNDFEWYDYIYISLGIDEFLTVLFRGYIHFSIPAITTSVVGIVLLMKKHLLLRGAKP